MPLFLKEPTRFSELVSGRHHAGGGGGLATEWVLLVEHTKKQSMESYTGNSKNYYNPPTHNYMDTVHIVIPPIHSLEGSLH